MRSETQGAIAPLPRVLALLIDAAWLLGVALPWLWWTSVPGRWAPTPAGSIGVLLLSLLAVPCWLGLGGTLGQRLLGQQLVDDRGAPRLLLRQSLLRWLAAWLTLCSLLYLPLWRDGGARTQTWHGRLSGTKVVERDPDDARSVPLRHWLGELPLAESLWLYALALPLPLLLLLGAVQALTPLSLPALRFAALPLLPGWVLLLAVLVWGAVGCWRAAARPLRDRQRSPAPAWRIWGARALAVLIAATGLSLFALNVVPRLPEQLSLLFGHDPLGAASVNVSADGRRLYVKGALGLGSAARAQAALQASPQVRWAVFDVAGGRLPEAERIATMLRERDLAVRVSGECSGACVFAFVGGARRQLLPGARLALQRLSAGAFNPPYQGLLNRSLAQRLAALGLSPHLARKTLATPPTHAWVLEPDELAASGLVSVPERPLDVELPDPQGAVVADYAESLSASRLWQALERRFPGMQALAAEQMAAASVRGAEAVQEAGQQVVLALLPPLLARASAETRWLYVEVLLAQMKALADDDASCRALLLGDPAAYRNLPRELAWREAEWLHGALLEAPRNEALRRPKAIEFEVIRRTLGQRAPEYLAGIWRPLTAPASGEPSCARGRALLEELGTLAAPQRRLALRLMFERS
ncbi:MAG TPA: RDD family protein [Rubrivivax sp.]|nr:RDD family protein [Rubrivivax sp.]